MTLVVGGYRFGEGGGGSWRDGFVFLSLLLVVVVDCDDACVIRSKV